MANDNKNEETPLRPYEADGIQELDNNLPRWWVGVFVVTGIFAVLYLAYFNVIEGSSIQKEYAASLLVKVAAQKSADGEPTDLNAMIGHSPSIAKGKEVYTTNCVPCHGVNAQGVIGPNLTDKFWLHGGKPEQILLTVMSGSSEKGMPAWGGIIGEQRAMQVTAYIKSLKDSNPPEPKAPQGDAE
jgi:cytochrome c oxidase cbb3-type subunit III